MVSSARRPNGPRSFNGAALRRARKLVATQHPNSSTRSLQRGRAPKSAETVAPWARQSVDQVLQRGRAPKSAETPKQNRTRRRWETLQRGRAPKSAETSHNPGVPMATIVASTGPRSEERGNPPQSGPGFPTTFCFNGAALRRARKHDMILETCLKMLEASTGPRSEERGNPPQSGPGFPTTFCFNGAALRRARKRFLAARPSRLVGVASTGPRSEERGNGNCRLAGGQRCGASTGPRSEERGNVGVRLRVVSQVGCFNGAALRRARKPAGKKLSDGKAKPWLQRGRAPKSAETRLDCRSVGHHDNASTGPRSEERGNLGSHLRHGAG